MISEASFFYVLEESKADLKYIFQIHSKEMKRQMSDMEYINSQLAL